MVGMPWGIVLESGWESSDASPGVGVGLGVMGSPWALAMGEGVQDVLPVPPVLGGPWQSSLCPLRDPFS